MVGKVALIAFVVSLSAQATYMSCKTALINQKQKFNEEGVKSRINFKTETLHYNKKNFQGIMKEMTMDCNELLYSTSCQSVKGVSEHARKCEDGTVSYKLPSSNPNVEDKKSDYEGLCGPTAAVNLAYAYCKQNYFYPLEIAKKYFDDITPGVRPDTLTKGLNKLFNNNSECMSGTWKYYYHTNRSDFMNSMQRRLNKGESYVTKQRNDGSSRKISPFAVLISKIKGELHWVTVVDIYNYKPSEYESYNSEDCIVAYNEFGRQSRTSCSQFIKWSHQVNNSILTSFLPEYITIVFEPSDFEKFYNSIKERALQSSNH